jgi:hypothetical protein
MIPPDSTTNTHIYHGNRHILVHSPNLKNVSSICKLTAMVTTYVPITAHKTKSGVNSRELRQQQLIETTFNYKTVIR